MMRQFLPVAVDAQALPDFVRMMRSLLDFSYLAHSAQLSETELTEMDTLLARFHKTKRALIDAGIVRRLGAFDRLAKLHMLSHYTRDIHELGVPDGYSTETLEHLHIVYVKIPWRMSSRRDPLPQMENFVRRLEAMRLQRTVIDECYGEEAGADDAEIRRFAAADHAADSDDDDSDIVYGEDEAIEDSEHDVEVEGDHGLAQPDVIHYPRPAISVAHQPTVRHVPAHVLSKSYGASDFVQALSHFMSTKLKSKQPFHTPPSLLASDSFDVWHKATLKHGPLPFAPTQPRHRDVVRAHPLIHTAGRAATPAAFDTALFGCDPTAFGLNRKPPFPLRRPPSVNTVWFLNLGYHAGRVRAIFALPRRLQHVHSGPLVYLDFFRPFEPDPTNTHTLYRTTPVDSGERASLVLPLGSLVMACHLAPDFSSLPSPTTVRRRLLFNDFYNHFTFLLMAYWRRMSPA